jgi:hypothetical protein
MSPIRAAEFAPPSDGITSRGWRTVNTAPLLATPFTVTDLVMCEFFSDHGLNEIWWRILSTKPYVTQSFEFAVETMKRNLSVRNTAKS